MFTLTVLRRKPILQIPAALVTLGFMWLFPFLVHLIPVSGTVPIGARLLPIFYAPLLAAWLFHPIVGLASSLLMPFINHAFTGMPTFNVAVMTSIELSVFSIVLLALKNAGLTGLCSRPWLSLRGKLSRLYCCSSFHLYRLRRGHT